MKNFLLKKILLIISFSLLSCQQSKKQEITELSFPIYGNYCGPLYPPKGSKPLPIDSVDNACKNHDMCYDINGYLSKECDNQILLELKSITPNTESEKLIRKLLITYFSRATSI